MHLNTIKKLQRQHGIADMQKMINSGDAWKMEGSYGRSAMHFLSIGACVLPKCRRKDYYGNTVPSRFDVKDGTKGSMSLHKEFWSNEDMISEHLQQP